MDISKYEVGQVISGRATMRTGKTTPPKPFTDGSLIDVMKDVSKYTQISKSAAAILRDKDADGKAAIGTARTREGIIQGMFDRGHIEFVPGKRGKTSIKNIRPTEKGIQTYRVIKQISPEFVSPELTAKWEEALRMIERGEVSLDAFLAKQKEYCTAIANQMKAQAPQRASTRVIEPAPGDGTPCPKCGKPLVTGAKKDGAKFLKCSGGTYDTKTRKAAGCDYVDWLNDGAKKS